MSVESGKNLGGIGSIFLVIPVPFLSIVGIILVLFGMRTLSQAYNDPSIWKNTLYAVIFGIIGIVASGITLASLFFGGIFALSLGGTGILGVLLGVIVFLAVAFIFYLLEAIFIRKAFDSLAEKSGVGLFRTGGLLLLIGAILTIFIIGLFLIFVAWILILVAFFSIKSAPPQQQPYGYGPTQAPSMATQPPSTQAQPQVQTYCPNCGAPVGPNATFCPNCGKQLRV